MGQMNFGNAKEATALTVTSTPSADTDGMGESKEVFYQNDKFQELYGYFMDHCELKAALLTKSIFVVGGGYECDPSTEAILDNIRGNGKDSFQDIIFNADLGKRVARESYCEIVRAEDGTLINLKPLNPATMRIVYIDGLIDRYEQTARIGDKDVSVKKFRTDEIFHLIHNRMFDSTHGLADTENLDKELLAELESFQDTKKVMRQVAHPFIIFHLKSDDATKIAALETKMKNVRDKGDGYMIIPDDENILTYEVVQINPSQLLFQWRDDLRKKFYRSIGLPELIIQSGDATESGGKVGSLHFGNLVQREQRYLEQQIWNQLNLRVNFIPPETLATQLATDTAKDGQQQMMNFQPSDTTAGVGR